jgi:hypothetical protein
VSAVNSIPPAMAMLGDVAVTPASVACLATSFGTLVQ